MLKMFIDVSTAEIFFDGKKVSITRCIPEVSSDAVLKVDSNCKTENLQLFSLKEVYE